MTLLDRFLPDPRRAVARVAPADRRRVLPLVAHALALGYLLWVAAHVHSCCDVDDYYLPAGRAILEDGLLWPDQYAGYRFYLAPLVFGLLQRLLDIVGVQDVARGMPYALAGLYFVTSAAASLYIVRREGFARWWSFAIPLLFNPVLLTIVPYALQESVVLIFGIPLVFVLLARDFADFRLSCLVAALAFGLMVMARSTYLWLILPIGLFVLVRTPWRDRRVVAQGAALAALAVAVCVAPQSYVSWRTFGAISPLARSSAAQAQIGFGIDMLNYTTVFSGDEFQGMPVPSPYRDIAPEEKTAAFYSRHPAEGLFLVVAHVWSGLHYATVRPYAPKQDLSIVTGWLVASAAVVAYGLLGIARLFRRRTERAVALFVLATVACSCAYTALTATEARFGLLGFAALSQAAWLLATDPEGRGECLRALPLVTAYVALCIAFNALLLYRAAVPWPNP